MKKAVLISIIVLVTTFIVLIILGSGGMFQVLEAQKLARNGLHCEAFTSLYEIVIEHPKGMFKSSVLDGLTNNLLACSQELIALEKPCEAFDLYHSLDDTNIEGIVDQLDSQFLSEAIMLCSQSASDDGILVLQQTYDLFCENSGGFKEVHPAVGLQGVKKIWSPWIVQNIPYARSKNELFATEPGELRFVLCDGGIKTQYEDMCFFDGGFQLSRYVKGTSLNIIDTLSGDEVARGSIFNMDIGACPMVHWFKSGSFSDESYGPSPSIDMIKDWIFLQLSNFVD